MDNLLETRSKSSGHGFGIGLLVGSLAGIAAYYLMGTKEGNRLRQKLIHEFEHAQTQIPQEIEAIIAETREADHPSPQDSTTMSTTTPTKQTGLLHTIGQSLRSLKLSRSGRTEPMPEEELPKETKRFFTKSGKKLN